ncbi:hypothetical protein [uncultured Methylobacterium sp.]|uniref:hypothetical protein n=1 Tax=uncultured Methylobacterium sp. TaxID=157278 RepID=UPI0025898DAD|nr:hypothetical protein [uncultured Methylobacterium sp.]
MPHPTEAEPSLEQRTIAAHRLYLAALMRVEALEALETLEAAGHIAIDLDDGTRGALLLEHRERFQDLTDLVDELGYVPKGFAKRSEIERERASAREATAQWGGPRPQPQARAGARAAPTVRSA